MAYQLTPQENSSLLSRIGSGFGSGISMVGNLFDLPGSMARDVLRGHNPFDQLLDPFGSENRSSGRDVLEHYGMLGKNKEGFDWGDVAGIGADVLLDPMTFFNPFGTLSKAGVLARKAGILNDLASVSAKGVGRRQAQMQGSLRNLLAPRAGEAAEETAKRWETIKEAASKSGIDILDQSGKLNTAVVDAPLRGQFGIGLPFKDPAFTWGAGKRSQAIASTLDTIGETAKNLGPVKYMRGLFDAKAGGQFTKEGQDIAEMVHAAKPDAYREAAEHVTKAQNEFDDLSKHYEDAFGTTLEKNSAGVLGPNPPDHVQRLAYKSASDLLRYIAEGGDTAKGIQKFVDPQAVLSPDLTNRFNGLADQMVQANKSINQSIYDRGGLASFIPDANEFQHFPRYVDPKTAAKNADYAAKRVVSTTTDSMKGRTTETATLRADVIKELQNDDLARMPNAAAYIESKYGPHLGKDTRFANKTEHAKALAEWVQKHTKDDLYRNTPLDDQLRYQRQSNVASRMIDAIHETVKRNMSDTGDGIELGAAYANATMDAERSLKHLESLTGVPLQQLEKMKLPVEVVNAMKSVQRVLSPVNDPEWARKITGTIDTVNRWFKNAVTLPFPSFVSRNLSSGQMANILSGEVQSAADVASYMNSVKSAMKKSSPEWLQELKINGVYGHTNVGFDDVESFRRAGQQGPLNPLDLKGTYQDSVQRVADNPSVMDSIPGMKQARITYGAVLGTGSAANDQAEFINRVAMYDFLRKKGFSPQAAGAKVRDIHVDYGDMAPFEKLVMKRLVPFYAFTKGITPYIIDTLKSRPGGSLSHAIQASAAAHGVDPTTPDYVADTTSIPLAPAADGSKRYVTGLGIFYEDPLSFMGGGVRGAGLEALSRMNPLVKGPLEWFTNESFFQKGPSGGRELGDLDPTIGRLISNITKDDKAKRLPAAVEFVAGNSPISRLLTTGRMLTDTRKSAMDKLVPFLTGTRISTISPAAQDAVLRERAMAMSKDLGSKSFTKIYFPEDDKAKMSTGELQQAQHIEALMNELAKRSKERKAAKQKQGVSNAPNAR